MMRGLYSRGLSSFVIGALASLSAHRSPAAERPSIIRGPYLQSLLDTSVVVMFTTSEPLAAALTWGVEGGPDSTVAGGNPTTEHRFRLEGLAPGKIHRYSIHTGLLPLTQGFTFRTSPPTGAGGIRVAVIGDSGSGSAAQLAVAGVMEEMAPDFILHVGDIDYEDDMDLTFFRPYQRLLARSCIFPAQGNHDIFLPWPSLFVLPGLDPKRRGIYYSFDWGSAHFAVLDTERDLFEEPEQLDWLAADLEAARARAIPWLILSFHRPLFTIGAYAFDEATIRGRVAIGPIADRYGVDLILSGHDHNYQRSHPVRGAGVRDAWQDPRFDSPRGTVNLVTGGGGTDFLYQKSAGADERFTRRFISIQHAVEVDIKVSEIHVRVVSHEKQLIDEFRITKAPRRPGPRLVRGDVDFDGALSITDGIGILLHLFQGLRIDCPEAARIEAAGGFLSITDAVYLLNYLFLGGPPPRAPFPECAPALGGDDAWCVREACGG